MAWIEKKTRGDGMVSAYVIWRLGGGRTGEKQIETFSAGTSEQNLARAEGFLKMVVAGGQRWPAGWVKGEGFVRPNGGDPLVEAPMFRRHRGGVRPADRRHHARATQEVRVAGQDSGEDRDPWSVPVCAVCERDR